MNWFERWFVSRVFARQVRQGYDHDRRITELYNMINSAARHEFFEDNKPTQDAFLREQFEKSLGA